MTGCDFHYRFCKYKQGSATRRVSRQATTNQTCFCGYSASYINIKPTLGTIVKKNLFLFGLCSTTNYELLMLKVPFSGKDQCDAGLVGGGNNLIIFL